MFRVEWWDEHGRQHVRSDQTADNVCELLDLIPAGSDLRILDDRNNVVHQDTFMGVAA